MARKFPPKGYRQMEYPLPHEFEYKFGLNIEDETKNTVVLPILRADESCLDAETINVNPTHLGFVEETGAACQMGSIVPKISMTINAFFTKLAFTTHAIRQLVFQWAPIYTAFEESLTAEDTKTGIEIEDIVELDHQTGDKEVLPLFVADVKVGANHPLSTINKVETLSTVGLTTSALLESVAFSEDDYFDCKSYYTNGSMLNKVMPRLNTARVTYERNFHYHSNNFTNPTVKRMNPYTFCGLMVHLPQCSSTLQPILCGDITEHEAMYFHVKIKYDEWNPLFDQTHY